jgi:hypothetical protein
MPYVALQMLNGEPLGQPHVTLAGQRLPTTVGPYYGALPVYIFAASYLLFDHSLIFRLVNIAYGLLSVVLAYLLGRDLLGSRRAGLVAAMLMGAIPTAVFFSRVGEFTAFVRVPITMAVLLLAYRFTMSSRPVLLFCTFLVLGLGFNVRLEMVWVVPGLFAWWALPSLRPGGAAPGGILLKRVLLAAAGFLVGVTPFSVYAIRDWRDILAVLSANLSTTTAGANNRDVIGNLITRSLDLVQLVDGRAAGITMAPVANHLNTLVFVGGVICAMFAVFKTNASGRSHRGLQLLLWVIGLGLLQSVVTLSVFKTWHVAMFLPIAVLLMGLCVDQLWRWRRWAGLGLAVLLLASNVGGTIVDYQRLRVASGSAGFSPAIYSLVEQLRQRGVPHVVAGDWGLARLIYVLSQGTVPTTEVVVYAAHPPMPAWFHERLEELAVPGRVWVFHSPGLGDLDAQEAFRQHLATNEIPVRRETIRDQYGPVYEVYSLDGVAAPSRGQAQVGPDVVAVDASPGGSPRPGTP